MKIRIYLLTTKITDLKDSQFLHDHVWDSYCRGFPMLDITFSVWLRLPLTWCNMNRPNYTFASIFFTGNINHRYFNFLFEHPSLQMFLICSSLYYQFSSTLLSISLFLLKKSFMFNNLWNLSTPRLQILWGVI